LAALSLLALAGAGCRAAMPARPSDPVGSSRPAAAIEPAPSPPIAAPAAPSPPPPLSAAAAAAILRVRGAEIVDGAGQPIQLRGVAFGNEVWGNVRLPRRHHGEVDYQRVAAMGMNVVRFYMNHRTFEGSRPAASAGAAYLPDGWQWIDDNVAWARRNGVRLVLNMHVPPGGFQSLGAGKALWDDPITQDRLIQLWTAIAARYRGESTIAGYDLLNEPVTTRSKDQWRELAGRLARAIRRVDPEHMLFVERLNAVAGDWAEDADRNFFTIDDPNTVYEFHFYKPFHFTHQMASWVPFTAEDVRYPDARAEVEWFLLDRKGGTDASPKLPPGDTPWTFYEGAPFRVDDPTIVVGKPVLMVKGNSGTVFFDDLVLEQLDEAGQVKRVIWKRNLTSNRGWFLWSKDGSGGAVPGHSGHGDDASLVAAGTRGDANLGSDVLRFRTEPGATYRLSGWMRGQKIPPEAVCQIRLDFFSSRVPVQSSDRAFLTQEIDAYVEWGRRHQVPLFLGEFGVIRFAFDDDRGGLRWVSDLLDILAERRLHFSYHAYHDDGFGLYRGAALPNPDSANRALIDLFTRKLAPAAPAAVATPPPPPVRAGGA
jgi:endoglucanase